jgi:hypothetical protein
MPARNGGSNDLDLDAEPLVQVDLDGRDLLSA